MLGSPRGIKEWLMPLKLGVERWKRIFPSPGKGTEECTLLQLPGSILGKGQSSNVQGSVLCLQECWSLRTRFIA